MHYKQAQPACPASGPAAPRDYKARGQPDATRARSGGGGATAPRTHAHTSTSFAPVCVSAFFLCMRRGGQQSAGAAAHRGVNAFRAMREWGGSALRPPRRQRGGGGARLESVLPLRSAPAGQIGIQIGQSATAAEIFITSGRPEPLTPP